MFCFPGGYYTFCSVCVIYLSFALTELSMVWHLHIVQSLIITNTD